MPVVIGDVIARISADVSGFNAGMDTAKKKFEDFGNNLKEIGTTLTKFITVPLVGAATGASTAAIGFEQAFAGIRKTVDASETEFQALSTGIREMAKTIPVGANELARLGQIGGQLGIPVDKLLPFIRTMADIRVTTDLTSEQAANAFARIASVMGIGQDQFDRMGSTVVALGNKFATAESEIVEMARRMTGTGRIIGLTTDQIFAFAAAMAQAGIRSQLGGTAFSRIIADMASAVQTGSDDLATFAAVAGLSITEFTQLFTTQPAEAFARFVEGVGRVSAAGGNVFGILKTLGFAGDETRQVILGLAGSQDKMREALQVGSVAWQENTALTKEAELFYGITANQLKVLWNNVIELGIAFGNTLLPVIKTLIPVFIEFIDFLSSLVTAFASLPMPIQVMTFGLAALAAAMGPVIFLLGTLISNFGVIAGAISSLTATTLPGLVAFMGPQGLLVLGAVALAGGIALLIERYLSLQSQLDAARNSAAAFQAELDKVATVSPIAATQLQVLQGELARTMDPQRKQQLQKQIDALKQLGKTGATAQQELARTTVQLGGPLLDKLRGTAPVRAATAPPVSLPAKKGTKPPALPAGMQQAADRLIEDITGITTANAFRRLDEAERKGFQFETDTIAPLPPRLPETFTTLGQALDRDVTAQFQDAASLAALLGQQFDPLTTRAQILADTIRSEFPQMGEEARASLMPLSEELLQLQQQLDMRDKIVAVMEGISSAISRSFTGILQGTQTFGEAFQNIWQTIWLGVTEAIIDQWIKDITTKLFQLFNQQVTTGGGGGGGGFLGFLTNIAGAIVPGLFGSFLSADTTNALRGAADSLVGDITGNAISANLAPAGAGAAVVNMNVVTPNVDSFRASQQQLTVDMALAMRRAQGRNG